ncbi:MAG: hypothetical protein BWY76_00423 [bacterium ADurb.Bin429]|nr:MAG: hypothetical protein BWY76_00423 [bacterium ADurb.Bin429]
MRTLLVCLMIGTFLSAVAVPALAEETKPRITIDVELRAFSDKKPIRRITLSDPTIPTPPATGEDITRLVRDLASADDNTGKLAAVRLFNTGDPAVSALGTALRAEHAEQRRYAALVLMVLGTNKAMKCLRATPMPWLYDDLRSDDSDVAQPAAMVMVHLGTEKALAAVCDILKDADAEMDLRMSILYGFTLAPSPKCVPAVEMCLRDENPYIRYTAITTYAILQGDKATDKLLTLLPDTNPVVRITLMGILAGKKDPRVRDALVTILLHDDANWARAFAAVTLQDNAQQPNVLPYLTRAEKDPSRLVQVAAAIALDKDISEQDFKDAMTALMDECGGTDASFVIEGLKGKIEGEIKTPK